MNVLARKRTAATTDKPFEMTDYPPYAERLAKHEELTKLEQKLTKRSSELWNQLHNPDGSTLRPVCSEADQQALMLLNNADCDTVQSTIRAISKEHQETEEKLDICRRALSLCNVELNRTRAIAGRMLCESRRPQYAEIAKRMIKAMKEVRECAIAESQFRWQCEADGAPHFTLPTLAAPWLGAVEGRGLNDQVWRVDEYLKWLKDNEYTED